MQTFRQNRATLLLSAVLTLAGSATTSAQQPAIVDSAVLKKAGTPADQFPGSWDPVKHTLVWRGDGGGGIGGGTVTTGGNLVFQTSNDGRFAVWSADKGEKLYEIETGKRGVAPPITYEIDGKQYVAFMAGSGRPAGEAGPNDARVDNPPMLFVFALDGKAELPAPVPTPPAASAAAPTVR